MGYYTEFKCKLKLKKDTPEDVLSILKRVVIQRDLGIDRALFKTEDVFKPELGHEFFECERWYMLLISNNFGCVSGGKMYEEKGYWVLDLHTEFKNYDCEISKFIDWISPFVVGRKKKEYVGWWQGEDMNQRVNVYIERNTTRESK